MKTVIEIEIEDESDYETASEVLRILETDFEGDDTNQDKQTEFDFPSDTHKDVFAAVQRRPGHALKIIHRELVGTEDTKFDSEEDQAERDEVKRMIWELEDRELTENEGKKWYPSRQTYADAN